MNKIISLSILFMIGMYPVDSFSSESQPLSSVEVDENHLVIVTKRVKNLLDLGLSVQVLNEQTLSSLDSAESITDYLSGVQAAVSNGSQTTFQIRGIGAVDHQALTPTAAAVYVDGVYMATNVQSSLLLFDLQRAEVIKGPQGTLYGRNASAGAIQFISAEAEFEQDYRLRLGVGNYGRRNLNWMVNTRIDQDTAVRFSGRKLSRHPALDNIVTNQSIDAPEDAGGRLDEYGVRLSLKYVPDDKTDIIIRAHRANDQGINPAPFNDSLSDILGSHQISIGPDGIQDSDSAFYGVAADYRYRGSEYQLDWLTAYEGYQQKYGFDFDGTPAPFANPNLNANLAYDRKLSQTSTEIRLSSTSQQLEWMLGLHLSSETFDQDYLIWCGELDANRQVGDCTYVGAPGRVGPEPASDSTVLSLLSEIAQDRKTLGIFTFNTIEVTEALDAVVGARFSYEEITGRGRGQHLFSDGTIALNNRDNQGLAEGDNVISENQLTAHLGLNYQISAQQLGYVSLSNGFKSGGFNGEVINNALHFSDQGLFQSEKVTSLEMGIKVAETDFNYSLAAFSMRYKRPQARIFVPFELADGGSFVSNSLSNLEKAKAFGIEADLDWQPTTQFNLTANATWLDTEIIQNINPQVPQNAATFNGNPLPFAADFSIVTNAQYRWYLANNMQLTTRISAKYQDDFYLDAEGLEDRKQEAYTLYQANINLLLANGIELSLWGKNLSDQNYAISGYGFIGYNRFLGEPRSYGFTLSLNY